MCAAVLAMAVRTMTLTRVLTVLVPVLLMSAPAPEAADSVPDGAGQSHVRIIDQRLRTLFEESRRSSPTLRALVSRLEESDVVVYLQSEPYASSGLAGRLSFLSVVSGVRYVVVHVTSLPSTVQQVAMVAHELQHAVEVAERPEIVDGASMFREYMRIGYVKGSTWSGVAVDTRAAIEVEGQVTNELRSTLKLAGRQAEVTSVDTSGE